MGFLKDLTWLNWLKPFIEKKTLRAWTPNVMKHQDFSHVSSYLPRTMNHQVLHTAQLHVRVTTLFMFSSRPASSPSGTLTPPRPALGASSHFAWVKIHKDSKNHQLDPPKSAQESPPSAAFRYFCNGFLSRVTMSDPFQKSQQPPRRLAEGPQGHWVFSQSSPFSLAPLADTSWPRGSSKQVSVCLKKITLRNHHWICSLYTQHYLYNLIYI